MRRFAVDHREFEMVRPRFWAWLVVTLVVAAFASTAQAQVLLGPSGVPMQLVVTPNSASFRYIPNDQLRDFGDAHRNLRSIAATGSGMGATVSDAVVLRNAGFAGSNNAVTAARTLSGAQVAKALASGIAKSLLPISVGMELWDAFAHPGVRITRDGAGGLLYDPGIDPDVEAGWTADFHGDDGFGPTSGQALDAAIGGYNARPERSTSINNGSCMRKVTYERGTKYEPFSTAIYHAYEITRLTEYTGTPANGASCGTPSTQPGSEIAGASASETASTTCPASIDASNPAYSIPAGSPVGPDGKCPSARYNHEPIPIPDAAAKLQEYPPSPSLIPSLLDDALKRGGETEAPAPSLSGIPSTTGTPVSTTTQNPDGSTRTETKTPKVTYNYGGDTVTWNVSNTTIINNAGDITTIEEDETPPEDPCEGNPNTMGCLNPGEAPEGPDIETDREVSFAPDAGWGVSDAACPANVSLPNSWGVPLEFNYAPVCQFLTMLRPVVIALGALAAAFIFMGYGREADA